MPFGLVQAQDFFLDCVGGHKVIDSHVLVLTDSVGSVGSLLLNCRIPTESPETASQMFERLIFYNLDNIYPVCH